MRSATSQVTHNWRRVVPAGALGFALVLAATPAIWGNEIEPRASVGGASPQLLAPFWMTFLLQVRAIEDSLAVQNLLPPSGEATQAGVLAEAQDQQARYAAAGIAPDLTDDEILAGLDAVKEARSTILGNPSEFTDPGWEAYLDMLCALRAELEAALSESRGARVQGEISESAA